MALVNIINSCFDSLTQVSEFIEGAIVYLDSGCTESFQFLGAFPTLLELGAKAVCSLENLGSLDTVLNWDSNSDPARNIVVFTSCLLSDAHRYILRCLHMHQGVRHCTIFTSISEIAHSVYPDSPLGPDAFHEYESLLLQDYEELVNHARKDGKLSESLTSKDERVKSSEEGGPHPQSCSGEKITYDGYPEDTEKNMFISVRHFPMILCPLSPRVFVLPSQGSVGEAFLSAKQTDSLSPGLPSISTGLAHDGDDVPPGALLTAHFLYHLAAKMDLKMEIFSFGDLSRTVGKMMTDMSSLYDVGRRKRSAGLLLIDRTLDLLTPCCHGDSLVDCMFSSLPRRENKASYSVTKDSQAQLKLGHKLQRAPLDVQIPLAKILSEGEAKKNGSLHLENIEAFLAGWDSYKLAPEVADMSNLTNKTNHEKPILSENQLFDGSFVSTEAFRGTPYIEAILDRSTKDGAVLVKKWLLEALRRENITVNVKPRSGVATKSELLPMIKALAKNQSSLLKNKGIIQLAAALLVTLVEPQSIRWDAFMSAEKILTASAVDTSQSLAAQIGDLINESALVGLTGQKNSKTELSKKFKGGLSEEEETLSKQKQPFDLIPRNPTSCCLHHHLHVMENTTVGIQGKTAAVIQDILRFLSLRDSDAARTSAVSKEWLPRWRRLPQLVFDEGCGLFSSPSHQNDELVEIQGILLLHEGPITKFTLSLPGLRSSHPDVPMILHWVFKSYRDVLEDFTLSFAEDRLNPNSKYRLQSSFFMLAGLRNLELTRCIFTTPRAFGATFVTLKASLVTLMLREVELDENFFQSFIPGCPLLQELGIICCTAPNHFNVQETKIRVIKLQWKGDRCASMSFTNTPFISSVTIMALDEPKKSVAPMELDGEQRPAKHMKVYHGLSPKDRFDFNGVFGSLTLLGELHTNGRFLHSLYNVGNDVPLMPNLSFLDVVEGMRFFDERDVSSMLCLMRSSPNLKKLHITLEQVDYGTESLRFELEEEDYADLSFEHLNEALFYHVAKAPEINFIKNLLAKAPVLKRFTFLPMDSLLRNQTEEVRDKVLSFYRKSPQVLVRYRGPA